jgi:hypothetical protein
LAIRRSLLGPGQLQATQPSLCYRAGEVYALCPDGAVKLLQFQLGAHICDAESFRQRFGERAVLLEPAMEAT